MAGERFQKIVADAKTRIREIAPEEAAAMAGAGAVLIDVRELDEFEAIHALGARHVSRGLLELDIEELVPDLTTPIVTYCGGGGRSALAADMLQKMGYTKVRSVAGGFRAWQAAGLPVEAPGA